MLFYRLDTLKTPGGNPIASSRLSAADDVEAVRLARSLGEGFPMELWCGDRRVKRFPAAETHLA